ncbi:uncharacterized protein LOC112046686 [Bicyclus anynana]|uniref:Regulatory protein zeste n=1 Tax=Bicyclus anynana TaxID=110368 RepID=A0A6J1MU38_BICAN|nr:uncharacterized protein LOC112046686 [Bicyclus anynana]
MDINRERDVRANHAQMKLLLDLLSADGMSQNGKVVYTHITKIKFWKYIAAQLNRVDSGATKSYHKWSKVWADWKSKTKKKAYLISRNKLGSKASLTKLEFRLLKLIKYPVDELLNNCSEEQTYEYVKTKNLKEEIDSTENSIGDNSTDGFNEENSECITLEVQPQIPSHSYNVFGDDKSVSDIGQHIKEMKEMKDIETDKAKVHLALEKEKIHQKNEELRLKAIELKLKADELKLQENECNRVNHLTELEEQKLKCMTDIAASLKELVEFTRNGGTRFHNVM